jgi:hypothetical protein
MVTKRGTSISSIFGAVLGWVEKMSIRSLRLRSLISTRALALLAVNPQLGVLRLAKLPKR